MNLRKLKMICLLKMYIPAILGLIPFEYLYHTTGNLLLSMMAYNTILILIIPYMICSSMKSLINRVDDTVVVDKK